MVRATSVTFPKSSILGTIPEVLKVTFLLERPYALSSIIKFIASTTGSKFNNGSPMPIITTFVMGLSFGDLGTPKELAATQTWPMISSKFKFLENPCLPVAQKLQSTAQPT